MPINTDYHIIEKGTERLHWYRDEIRRLMPLMDDYGYRDAARFLDYIERQINPIPYLLDSATLSGQEQLRIEQERQRHAVWVARP